MNASKRYAAEMAPRQEASGYEAGITGRWRRHAKRLRMQY
jgi:hypothetical protein